MTENEKWILADKIWNIAWRVLFMYAFISVISCVEVL